MLVENVCTTLRSFEKKKEKKYRDCWHVTKAHLPLYVFHYHTAQIKSVASYRR